MRQRNQAGVCLCSACCFSLLSHFLFLAISFTLKPFAGGKRKVSILPSIGSSSEEESDCVSRLALNVFVADMGAYRDKIGALTTSLISLTRQSLDYVLQNKVNITDLLLLQKKKEKTHSLLIMWAHAVIKLLEKDPPKN